ncbi:hypothetical protein [Paenibacillus xylanilyticus]|uniref:hypothetical protein n=1 Tax=Paenibacillus xylanilyticus TaxID=248903 RepID=UPI003AABA0A2
MTKKKLSKLKAQKAHVKATYTKIIFPVPKAPVNEALPETMSFYVDTRFTAAQSSRLKQLIGLVLNYWKVHYDQLDAGAPQSAYQRCVNKYAKFNLAPVWFEEKLSNGSAAAGVQMDGFTTQIIANGFGRSAKAFIMYQESGTSTIKGFNASNPETNSLTVTINATDLSKTSVTNQFLAGSLQHAWLHREGYRHPTGKYTGYFAGECSMCVMRGSRDKTANTPDSFYTEWLD